MWKLLLVSCVLGCSGNDGMPAEPDAGMSPTIDAAAAPALGAGTWQYTMYAKSADTCGNRVEGNDRITIDMTTATSFRVTWPGSVPIASACSVGANKAFTCTTPTATIDRRPTYDALITLDVELAGNITTTTLATGNQRISVGCTGSECVEANASPCSVAATITIMKV